MGGAAAVKGPGDGATVVLFDYGGTLDAEGVPWKERFRQVFAAAGITVPDDRFDRAFYDADDAIVGAVPETLPLDDTVALLAAGVGRNLGVDAGLAARAGARFVADSRAQLERNAALLAVLARRYRLGIVSNFYGNLAAVCRDAGIDRLFGALVDSTVVGIGKPDAGIFLAALDALGAAPAEAVFVGDSYRRDMTGAGALGMRRIWLRSEVHGEPLPPDFDGTVIDRFAALRELLG